MKTISKIFFATITLISFHTFAGEGLFSRPYTTETVPQGHYELEQVVRNRTQRAYGEYSAYDFKTEFEYGVTDNFQAALYINAETLHAKGAPDDNDIAGGGDTPDGFTRDRTFIQSLSAEFIYRVMSPVLDPVGLAFYWEPTFNFYDMHNAVQEYDSMENEFRLLLQKNLMGDQLILVYNLVVELGYFRYGNKETQWQGEADWNNEIGGSYRFASNWYGGLEVRNHNEAGNFWHHDHTIFWAGPSIHYADQRFWATFGVLKQVTGNPSGLDDNGSDQGPSGYFLHSHEMWETTLKVAMTF